jgi:hypothetical protein
VELTKVPKVGEEGGKKGEVARKKGEVARKKGGPMRDRWATVGRWPGVRWHEPADDQWSPTGCGPQSSTDCAWAPFSNFFGFFYSLGGSLGMALAFSKMGVQHSNFMNLAPTLGSVKSSIPHGT